jgi:hypothetical protein
MIEGGDTDELFIYGLVLGVRVAPFWCGISTELEFLSMTWTSICDA